MLGRALILLIGVLGVLSADPIRPNFEGPVCSKKGSCLRRCPRYCHRIPPAFAYPSPVNYSSPGELYERIYPAPPFCDCCEDSK